jgi:transmembrane sensor
MSSINHEIDRQAAYWAAKRDLQGLSPVEQAELDAWLAADARHLGAYGRAEAVLCRLDRLSAFALDTKPGGIVEETGWSRRSMVMAGSATAAAAAIVGIAPLRDGVPEETYSAQFGQMREIILSDGSVVSLNTDSKISVSFTNEARNVRLEQGEALFDVAKDKLRPFTVSAGNTRVRAVGTSFSVSRLPLRPVQVLVKEGVVELERANAPDVVPVRATANIQVIASADAPIVTVTMPQEKLARELEWQYGRIALDNETLESAAEEFARYSDVHIVVDPAISNRTVTGLFASNDPIGFAKAAAAVLKLQIEMKGDEVRIFGG